MDSAKALHKKGLELQQVGKQEEAITYFDKAIELEPNKKLRRTTVDALQCIDPRTALRM